MTYEIPQELQYKERIIFWLTFQQVLIAVGLGIPALLILKTELSFILRIVLASIPLLIAPLFMFFEAHKWIVHWWQYRNQRTLKMFDSAMKQFLQIAAVDNKCYYLWRGKIPKETDKINVYDKKLNLQRIAVLCVEPINFLLKSSDEKENIIHSFQKLLNGLDFSLQVCMFTDTLDLSGYIQDLKFRAQQTNNATALALLKGHQRFLAKIIGERSSMNRKFYIIISESQQGLETQTSIITDLLKNIGLTSVRVSNRQLIGVLLRYFNNPKGRTTLLAKNKNLHNIISPENISTKPDLVHINNDLHRTSIITGYPRSVEAGFLDNLITIPGNIDLSLHIEPIPLETTMVLLNRSLQRQRADLFASERKGTIQPTLEIQHTDTRGVLDSIQRGEQRLFNTSLYITCRAKNKDELHQLTQTTHAHLHSSLMTPKIATLQMLQGIQSTLPFGRNILGSRRLITTHALSAFFPFTSPFLLLEKGGVFLGLNKNKLPIIKDVFNLSNANGAILATSGSGKSYAAKLLLTRYFLTNTRIIVIDPQNEYLKLTEACKGSVITISRDSETIINPLDLLGHTYAEKRLALLDMFRVMFGELSEIQKAILDKAIGITYSKRGISDSSAKDKTPPILEDLYKELERLNNESTVYERSTYIALLNRLRMYVDGVFSFLNRQTKIDVSNRFITFNIGNMPKQVKPVMMFLILEYVYTMMKHNKERKLLVIDEAWSMLQNTSEEGFIYEVVKTCRKHNLGLLLITQDVADLLNSKAGRAVLANTSYNILLRQKPAVIDSITEVFHLSNTEREHLLTAGIGEGLLLMDNDHQELRIIASPDEHQLITTKPDELLNDQELPVNVTATQRTMLIELDLNKGYYKKSTLSPEQIDYLLKNNYHKSSHVPLNRKQQADYLVRKIGNTTPEHTFLVHAVAEELQRYTNKVFLDETCRSNKLNPDIRFTNLKGEEIALEIETGTNFRYNRDYLDHKVALLNKQYPNKWRFILTTNYCRRQYETRFNNPVLLRHQIPAFARWQFSQKQEDNTRQNGRAEISDDKQEAECPQEKLHARTQSEVKS